jgi:hypothetical protein
MQSEQNIQTGRQLNDRSGRGHVFLRSLRMGGVQLAGGMLAMVECILLGLFVIGDMG